MSARFKGRVNGSRCLVMISSGSAVANDCDLLSSVNVTRLSPVELEEHYANCQYS